MNIGNDLTSNGIKSHIVVVNRYVKMCTASDGVNCLKFKLKQL